MLAVVRSEMHSQNVLPIRPKSSSLAGERLGIYYTKTLHLPPLISSRPDRSATIYRFRWLLSSGNGRECFPAFDERAIVYLYKARNIG